MLQRATGDRVGAIDDLGRTIELTPTFEWEVIVIRSELYLARDEFEAALADFNRRIELKRNEPNQHKRRALCHFQLGHYSDALADIAKSLELNPTDTSAIWSIHPNLVAACPDRGFQLGLLKLADQALETNEGSASSLSARGLLLSALGDKEHALADIDKSLELDPNNGLLCNRIAWHFATYYGADPEMSKRAVVLAEKAASLKPDYEPIWNTLGVARYRAEDMEGAIEALEKSEELSGGQYSAHNGLFLAMAHARLGDEPEAQRWYATSIDWIGAHGADEEIQIFRSEAEEVLESMGMLPRRMGQTGDAERRAADQPLTQPDESTEPALEPAGADPS